MGSVIRRLTGDNSPDLRRTLEGFHALKERRTPLSKCFVYWRVVLESANIQNLCC